MDRDYPYLVLRPGSSFEIRCTRCHTKFVVHGPIRIERKEDAFCPICEEDLTEPPVEYL